MMLYSIIVDYYSIAGARGTPAGSLVFTSLGTCDRASTGTTLLVVHLTGVTSQRVRESALGTPIDAICLVITGDACARTTAFHEEPCFTFSALIIASLSAGGTVGTTGCA
eukprot:XP_001704456.1 Hypothetical protein GL50803_39305 [Giardia lamblia ATCC 50803]